MTDISVPLINAYIAKRKAEVTIIPARTKQTRRGVITTPEREKPVANATINRELAWLKHMFRLAVDAGKLMTRPKIKMLAEDNARQGFFEHEQYESMLRHLPEDLRPVVRFAYITGWRVKSEVLTLEWRHVDLKAGEVRLEPGTTKNKEGRTFPFTIDLKALIDAQHAEHERLKKKGKVVPWVFFRLVANGRGGPLRPKPITSFIKAFKTACRKAGCPGRIPHDLRRTAVRNLERAGIPRSVAMKLTGHKTESVYRRYAIADERDLRVAVERLNAMASAR
jgi:integrase